MDRRTELAQAEAEQARNRFMARAQLAGVAGTEIEEDGVPLYAVKEMEMDQDQDSMPPRFLPTAAKTAVDNLPSQEANAAAAAVRPGYFEIEVEGDTIEVGLRSRSGVRTVTIPPMTMKRINMLGWHQERVNRLQQQLLNTTKVVDASNVADAAKRAQEQLVIYMIPDFPVGMFGEMSAMGFKKLMDIIGQMTTEALDLEDEGGSDPNA